MTATARAASAGSSATTPTRVTVALSSSRTPSGMSATTTARPTSSSVENTNARDRTRSTYSRRATSTMLVALLLEGIASGGAGGIACGASLTRRPRPRRRRPERHRWRPWRPRRWRAVDRREVGLLVRRMADEVDEHLLEAGIGELEVGDLRPGVDRGREHDVRLEPGFELDGRSVHAHLDDPRPRDVGEPGHPVVAGDGDPDQSPAGGATDVADRPADHDPPAVDDRHGLAQRLRHLHLVGREDDRAPAVAELEEGLAQEHHVDRVEPRERLVHEQDLRVVQHRGDELDLLLVALGQLLRRGGRRGPRPGTVAARRATRDAPGRAAGPGGRRRTGAARARASAGTARAPRAGSPTSSAGGGGSRRRAR